MELSEKLRSAANMLDKNPEILRASAHSDSVQALEKKLDSFIDLLRELEVAASPVYNRLRQALGKAKGAKRIGPSWIGARLKGYGLPNKPGEAGLRLLARAAVQSGDAETLTKELERSPEALLQEEFRMLAAKSPEQAGAILAGKFKGKKLTDLCSANGIPILRTKKGALDTKGTYKTVLMRLQQMRDRL